MTFTRLNQLQKIETALVAAEFSRQDAHKIATVKTILLGIKAQCQACKISFCPDCKWKAKVDKL